MKYRGGDIEIRARRQAWSGHHVEIAILSYEAGEVGARRVRVAKDVVFETLEDSEPIETTLRLEEHFAQKLMDELWDCGIRPTQGKGSAGQLEAVQRHLGDMRAIVAQTVKVDLP